MKKKKLATSIAAVALAVATIFTGSNLPSWGQMETIRRKS